MSGESVLARLEAEIDRLERIPYGPEVRDAVERILNEAPDPASLSAAQEKVRAYLVRGRSQLLLPSFQKEAEVDLSKALKFNQQNVPTWIALGEAYLRRNAFKEARDAIEAALRIEPKSGKALVRLSQVLRCEALKETSFATKLGLLESSEAKAKEAIGVDINDSDAWASLGMTLLQQALLRQMDLPTATKALKAYSQAEAKQAPAYPNPDVYYNRAVLWRVFGEFGKAANDFRRAFDIDPKGLPSAKAEAEAALAFLTAAGHAQTQAPAAAKTKRPAVAADPASGMHFVSLAELRAPAEGPSPKGASRWVMVKVSNLLSGPQEQPLVYLAVDNDGEVALVLLHRLNASAIKPNDFLWIPFPPSSFSHSETGVVQAGKVESETPATHRAMVLLADPTAVLLNGGPIDKKKISAPQSTSRLFQ